MSIQKNLRKLQSRLYCDELPCKSVCKQHEAVRTGNVNRRTECVSAASLQSDILAQSLSVNSFLNSYPFAMSAFAPSFPIADETNRYIVNQLLIRAYCQYYKGTLLGCMCKQGRVWLFIESHMYSLMSFAILMMWSIAFDAVDCD